MNSFFLGTSFLLYYLGFVFVGQGVGELQIAGVISSTNESIPTVAWLGVRKFASDFKLYLGE